MKLFKKNQLALLLPLLVVGCAGKGGFDPLTVENEDTGTVEKQVESSKPKQPSKPVVPPKSLTPNEPNPTTPVAPSDTDVTNNTEHPSTPQEAPELIVTQDLLGWALDITRRNKARFKEDGTKYADVKRVRTDDVVIDFPGQAESYIAIDPQKMKYNQGAFKPSSGFENVHIGFENYSTSTKNDVYNGQLGSEHEVYTGAVGTLRYQANNTAKALPESDNEFTYKGIWAYMTDIDVRREELAPPSESGETVTWTSNGRTAGVDYSGSSEFDDVVRKRSDFSDVEKDRNGRARYKDKGHFAEFKVHFGEKRLTGTLSRTPRLPREAHNAYNIEASINGHRFSGSATVNPLADKKNENNLYFKENSRNVQGGFYGETGQELAGSFIADDNSIAVAFGAKRQGSLDENQTFTHLIDGVRINVDHNEDFTPFALNNIRGSNYLFVDGYNIPLAKESFVNSKTVTTADGEIRVNYCCDQFEHITFGEINHTSTRHEDITNYDNQYDDDYYRDEVSDTQPNKYAEGRYFKDQYYIEQGYQDGKKLKYTPFNRSLFLQGERSKEIPKEGTVRYQGSWQANIVHRNIPHSVTPDGFAEGTRAAFEANFNDKKLTGQLWRKNDVSRAPSVLIDADIKGVGFEGIARTGEFGITIDPDRKLNNEAFHFKAPTKGLFYGENAAELGGSFSFSGISYKDSNNNRVYDKVGAVYGAKQVSE